MTSTTRESSVMPETTNSQAELALRDGKAWSKFIYSPDPRIQAEMCGVLTRRRNWVMFCIGFYEYTEDLPGLAFTAMVEGWSKARLTKAVQPVIAEWRKEQEVIPVPPWFNHPV